MKIRALVVDDEPLARERVRALLAGEPDVELVGESATGTEAVAMIRQTRPDLVFLDVQMPGMNGFEVLRALDEERMPLVIFVTAYDQHALKAFEVHAFVASAVLILGLVTLDGGLNLMGSPLSLQNLSQGLIPSESSSPAQVSSVNAQGSLVLNVENDGYFPRTLRAEPNTPTKLSLVTIKPTPAPAILSSLRWDTTNCFPTPAPCRWTYPPSPPERACSSPARWACIPG